jgi:hypothetical protein
LGSPGPSIARLTPSPPNFGPGGEKKKNPAQEIAASTPKKTIKPTMIFLAVVERAISSRVMSRFSPS